MNTKIDDDTPIQLIFEPEKRLIVTFPKGLKGKAHFSQEATRFEETFKEMGIVIPIEDRDKYPELKEDPLRRAIYLEDLSFGKAFFEIFYPASLDRTKFKWYPITKSVSV